MKNVFQLSALVLALGSFAALAEDNAAAPAAGAPAAAAPAAGGETAAGATAEGKDAKKMAKKGHGKHMKKKCKDGDADCAAKDAK